MNIYYWCPFIDYVATVKAVLNSSIALNKFSKKINPVIINSVVEWDDYSKILKDENIKEIKLTKKNLYKNLPRDSYFKSRLAYLIISLVTFMNLIKFLKQRSQKDIIILHLITSLPLLLINFFNFKCKFVLRVSGHPKLNIFRRFLWKFTGKKLQKIFVPTIETQQKLINQSIFEKDKLLVLRDPIINISEINNKILKAKENKDEKYTIVSIGRLTKQKHHYFLINSFSKIVKYKKHLKLKILGKGELRQNLEKLIKNKGLSKNVELVGHVENIYNYLKNSFCFILTSKWEDPGFVIIESAAARRIVFSSDCESGPKEFIGKNEKCGYLFNEGDEQSFIEKFDEMCEDILIGLIS